ncbi:MAG: hypothetical protein ACI89M_001735 [Chitinophagales bacterium]|jgi:hypothetical protein
MYQKTGALLWTKIFALFLAFSLMGNNSIAQSTNSQSQQLDISCFWKKSGESLSHVEDKKGDLFSKLGHHGPAIENLCLAYRVYFNESGSVDILSKFQPRLELKKSKWYPKKNNCEEDYGTDNYDVGNSVGLGGINLYVPETGIQKLGPVLKRSAEIFLTDTSATLIMTSYGIPYKDLIIDIEFTLSTVADGRHANVTVCELNGQNVQFATGLSMHAKLDYVKGENYMLTWGDFTSHARYADFDIGAGLLYNPENFEGELSMKNQQLLISKPCSSLHYVISSCNDLEKSKLNSLLSFENYLISLSEKLNHKK